MFGALARRDREGALTGADLRCFCGGYARDVAGNIELAPATSYSWHCINGHHNISGHRPGYIGFQQEYYPVEPEAHANSNTHALQQTKPHSPSMDLAKPLPPEFVWCFICGAAKTLHIHNENS